MNHPDVERKIQVALSQLGVRIYRKTIVSNFSTRDSADKCALINFLIESCGYTLADERGYPRKPEIQEAAS